MNSASKRAFTGAKGGSLPRARKRALLAAAALAALSSAGPATAQRYWDVNGAAAGSGVTLVTPDWLGGGITASAMWDGATLNWNTNSTGGAGSFHADVGAGTTGVFSAGSDANGTYFIRIADGVEVNAGGFSISQGHAIIAGDGNGGQGAGDSPSKVNIGSGTFNVDAASGATLSFGYRLKLPTWTGSATITKTGAGQFNNFAQNSPGVVGNLFTGKYDVQGGTMGIFFGGNTALGNPASFVADQLTVRNNAMIKTYQESTSRSFNANEGITIGPGGATFNSISAKELDPSYAFASLGSIQLVSRITGGDENNRVPITIMSNTLPGSNGIGQGTGTTFFNLADNSSSAAAPPLHAKWIIKSGELGPARASGNNDVALGAVPASYLADAVTLDGGYLRPNAACTIHENRGITLGAGNATSGGIHPVANSVTTINSVITGAGPLRVYLENGPNVKVILAGANTYTGDTIITGWMAAAQGSLQVATGTVPGNIVNDGRLIFDQTFEGTYAGNISGSGNVTKSNTGAVMLTGSNTYSGGTTASGGVLIANTTSALPDYATSGKVTATSGGAIAASAGGAGQWSTGDIDTLRTTTTFSPGGGFGINVDGPNTFTYAANINEPSGFVKLGGGELQLTGASSYADGTQVLGGTLKFSSFNNLGADSGAITISNGATLKSLAGVNPSSPTRPLIMGPGGGVLDDSGISLTDMQSPINGVGSFTKAGGGTLVSGQDNHFNGLILQGGTFSFINDDNLGTNGGTITFDGGTLQPRTNFAFYRNRGTFNVTANGGTWDMNNRAVDASVYPVEGVGTFGTTAPGSLTIARIRTGGLNAGGGTLIIAENGTPTGTNVIGAVATPSGKLDLKDNKLIVTTAGSLASVQAQVAVGRGNGTWNGATGIATSMPDAVSGATTLAVALAGDVGKTAFGGQPVAATDTLVMYTYNGDGNFSGDVDADDYFVIDSNYNKSGSVFGFNNGDFTYDGLINGDDYAAIDAGFAASQSGPPFPAASSLDGVTAVPEPASGLLLLAASAALVRRRRH